MSLKYGLLGLLCYGPQTGYELNAAFKSSLSFFWPAKTSQIYRELNAMEKAGLLKSVRVAQTSKPDKRVYETTSAGRTAFKKWLLSPDKDLAAAMSVKSAFLMRVFFAGNLSVKDAKKLIGAFAAECKNMETLLGPAADAIPTYSDKIANSEKNAVFWRLTLLCGKYYYAAMKNWAIESLEILKGNENEHPCD